MKKKTKKHPRKRKKHLRKRKPVTAIVAKTPPVTAVVGNRERTLRPEEVALLKSTLAKNCTDEEFALFMLVCKKKKLDPFTKQVYCIKWPRRKGPDEMVIIVGIGGYRSMAARSHRRDFGGTSAATFTYQDTKLLTPAGRRIPESATVVAERRSGARGSATVFWEEFAPVDLKSERADFWNRMPRHMLAKCAEAHALRKVFPDLSDIYSEEEMSQRLQDLTPGGREISVGGVAPSGKQLEGPDPREQAQAVARAKNSGNWCERHHCVTSACPADEHTREENERVFNRAQEERTINVEATKVWPSEQTKEKAKDAKPKTIPQDANLRRGTVHRVVYGITKDRRVPYINVRVNQEWHTCWSKSIHKAFPSEAAVVAQVIEFYVDKAQNIIGLKRLGKTYFKQDGRTPLEREPGADDE